MGYNFLEIEKKWQDYWKNNQVYHTLEKKDQEKYYVLDMFPYPSGAGLSVGHPLGYIASDIFARYKRLKGFNVLHPMGYDSFGLPTEHYAIQTGIHPADATKTNTSRYREQLDKIGFSYDWNREVQTSDPNYYKWTQWIFKEFFNSFYCIKEDKAKPISELINHFKMQGNQNLNAICSDKDLNFSDKDWDNFNKDKREDILQKYRLAFLSETQVNWCQELGTVLANDEVKDGLSERGGFPVEQKLMKQWSLRITAYADRLLSDLQTLDWSESIKEIQKNWIGRSEGAIIKFNIIGSKKELEIFTTRADTIFGVDFIVLAPEHNLVNLITLKENREEVDLYVKDAKRRSERDRQSDKSITGVFTGSYARHPFTGKKLPIWVADYVLFSYGTGAIMSVPCGDQRDWDFAQHFSIEVTNIFHGFNAIEGANEERGLKIENSDFLNGLNVDQAINKSIETLEDLGIGLRKINYRLRDAIFSRQRYWGEPFPVYYIGDTPYIIDQEEAILLPEIKKYLPTQDGSPPLARAKKSDWNIYEGERMEVNVMPGWAGSSWYFLRYMDPKNKIEFCSQERSKYWGQVDLYIGGAEHAVGHLLYSRFWTKFLFDRGYINFDEPFKKLINQGMILGRSNFVYRKKDSNIFITFDKIKDYETTRLHVDIDLVKDDILNIKEFKNWRKEYQNAEFILNDNGDYLCGFEIEKMSKSKYNVCSPDELINNYGADTLRLYEMFLGPLEQSKPWDTKGITGVHNFLRKIWRLTHDQENNFVVCDSIPTKQNYTTLHKTIKKVEQEIERYSFNTVVSTLMICINELIEQKCTSQEIITDFTILLSPYAPHISEEIWSKLGNAGSIMDASFPEYNEKYLIQKEMNYPVAFNGKMRFKIVFPLDLDIEEIKKRILNHEKTQQYLNGNDPKKIIVVPNRIINIVI